MYCSADLVSTAIGEFCRGLPRQCPRKKRVRIGTTHTEPNQLAPNARPRQHSPLYFSTPYERLPCRARHHDFPRWPKLRSNRSAQPSNAPLPSTHHFTHHKRPAAQNENVLSQTRTLSAFSTEPRQKTVAGDAEPSGPGQRRTIEPGGRYRGRRLPLLGHLRRPRPSRLLQRSSRLFFFVGGGRGRRSRDDDGGAGGVEPAALPTARGLPVRDGAEAVRQGRGGEVGGPEVVGLAPVLVAAVTAASAAVVVDVGGGRGCGRGGWGGRGGGGIGGIGGRSSGCSGNASAAGVREAAEACRGARKDCLESVPGDDSTDSCDGGTWFHMKWNETSGHATSSPGCRHRASIRGVCGAEGRIHWRPYLSPGCGLVVHPPWSGYLDVRVAVCLPYEALLFSFSLTVFTPFHDSLNHALFRGCLSCYFCPSRLSQTNLVNGIQDLPIGQATCTARCCWRAQTVSMCSLLLHQTIQLLRSCSQHNTCLGRALSIMARDVPVQSTPKPRSQGTARSRKHCFWLPR